MSSLSTEILVEVASNSNEASDHHRVIWCPYIPDEQAGGEEGDEPAHLLVLTHGPCVSYFSLLCYLLQKCAILLHLFGIIMEEWKCCLVD